MYVFYHITQCMCADMLGIGTGKPVWKEEFTNSVWSREFTVWSGSLSLSLYIYISCRISIIL